MSLVVLGDTSASSEIYIIQNTTKSRARIVGGHSIKMQEREEFPICNYNLFVISYL